MHLRNVYIDHSIIYKTIFRFVLTHSVRANFIFTITGQTGAIKAILTFETGLIPPNYGFQTPNPNCDALVKGKMKVVTEPTPFTAAYMPVNSFGFGGSFVQAILKKNSIEYPSTPEPEDLPRLILFPGNTEAAVLYMFDYIKKHTELRAEFFALLNKLSFTPTSRKPFRGYALLQKEEAALQIKVCSQIISFLYCDSPVLLHLINF